MSSGLGIGVTKTSSPVLSFLFAARFRKGKPALTTLYMPHAVGTCLSSKGPLVRLQLQGVKSDHCWKVCELSFNIKQLWLQTTWVGGDGVAMWIWFENLSEKMKWLDQALVYTFQGRSLLCFCNLAFGPSQLQQPKAPDVPQRSSKIIELVHDIMWEILVTVDTDESDIIFSKIPHLKFVWERNIFNPSGNLITYIWFHWF